MAEKSPKEQDAASKQSEEAADRQEQNGQNDGLAEKLHEQAMELLRRLPAFGPVIMLYLQSAHRRFQFMVGSARVFRQTGAVKIDHARHRVIIDVLEDRAIAMDGVPDQRLMLMAQTNYFRIAAAFKVKRPMIAPAMFVVSDQEPIRIGGQGRFPRSGQPEELTRSEERRVGKECRSRWSPYH